jgi:1,4-alpha-glucan branching enzyme
MERFQLGSWIAVEGGVHFRVWAPNAEQVSVVGDFNNWDGQKHPMQRDDKGCWYGRIPEAAVGHEYRYEIQRGDDRFTRVDPYAVDVTNSVGNGVISDLSFDWGSSEFHVPSKNDLVIYELHVGTFNVAEDGKPATLDDCAKRLDYLQSLGINAIELMPCAEFAGDYSWGYNPAHLFAVERAYGGPMALKRFIKAAHDRGMAVILDVVYNHFGPSDLSLWQFDGWSENGKGGIYFYNDWRSSTPWGETRPDYGRSEVCEFILNNARFWLEEFHVDGLRLDMTLYIRHVRGDGDPGAELPEGWQLTQSINEMVHQDFPGCITIAEDLQNNDWLTKNVADGGAGFDLQWDANFVHPVRRCVIPMDDAARSLDDIKLAIFSTYNGDAHQRVVYSESHDEVANGKARVPTEIDPDSPESYFSKKRSTLAAALALTVPGVPMIFQGQELLEDEWFRDTDPIEWSRRNNFSGIHRMYRDLIHLRRNITNESKGLTGSGVQLVYESYEHGVLAFYRWESQGEVGDVIVLLNISHETREGIAIAMPHTGRWNVRFNSDWSGYSGDFDDIALNSEIQIDGSNRIGHFSLAPYSMQIAIYRGEGNETETVSGNQELQPAASDA